MLSTISNKDGYIYGYAEWFSTNDKGEIVKNGDYVYVKNIWVHPSYRRTTTFHVLIGMIDKNEASQSSKWVYWKRPKYNERQTNNFSRERLAKMGVEA